MLPSHHPRQAGRIGMIWRFFPVKVIKRDGHTVDFDRMKIVVAIQKANAAVDPEYRIDQERIDAIADAAVPLPLYNF